MPPATPVVVEGDGLMAQALQHETDHLDGKLYIEGLDPERQARGDARRCARRDWFRELVRPSCTERLALRRAPPCTCASMTSAKSFRIGPRLMLILGVR